MEIGVLFSGGKDSSLAMQKALDMRYNVKCLISLKSENIDSWMFHTPNIEFVENQAEAMEIPIITLETKGIKEDELIDLKETIRSAKYTYNIKGIVTGAIHSVYQASRIQRICHDLGLYCFNPLWLSDQEEILKELVERNYHVIITRVAGEGLSKEWLGKVIDEEFIKNISLLKGDNLKLHIY